MPLADGTARPFEKAVLVGALTVLASGLVASPSTAAVAHPRTRTFVTMDSEGGDYIGDGVSRVFTSFDSSILTWSPAPGSVDISVNGGASGTDFTLRFASASGMPLGVGLYQQAQSLRAPS